MCARLFPESSLNKTQSIQTYTCTRRNKGKYGSDSVAAGDVASRVTDFREVHRASKHPDPETKPPLPLRGKGVIIAIPIPIETWSQ